MASKTTHVAIGAVIGAGIYILLTEKENRTPEALVGAVIAGATIACIPDILEPAFHPNHREFFHSFLVLGGIHFIHDKIKQSDKVSFPGKMATSIFSGSYASHLLLDAFTPKSLPLFGFKLIKLL